MTKLSPAAQAVWNAFLDRYEWEVTTEELFAVAAALRAAADQGEIFFDAYDDPVQAITLECLLAIAKELEAQ